jgi:YggT family protein
MGALSGLLDLAIRIYFFIIVAYVVLSMLVSFQVVNPRVPIIAKAWQLLYRLSEPSLRPIRRFLPSIAGIDLSPLVVLLVLQFLGGWIVYQLALMGL